MHKLYAATALLCYNTHGFCFNVIFIIMVVQDQGSIYKVLLILDRVECDGIEAFLYLKLMYLMHVYSFTYWVP